MTGYLIPIRDPELSQLDGSGNPELHAARFTTRCGDCQHDIPVGGMCALIDREMVCADCTTQYAPFRP